MDKQLYINELKRVFLTDDNLKSAITPDNQDMYFEFQQRTFDLWGLNANDLSEIRRKHDFIIKSVQSYLSGDDKQLLEVNTLLEVSSTKKQFNELYTKKYGVVIGKLDSDTKKSKELSSFDKKLVTALNYNWKEEE
ncbi:hypothetical protein [Ligilactobacillus salivarius]|uniref:hypothetical protein n=1 Tax=Ligilactobacillus salivarius TaxID=1624 RepID=UPI000BAFFE9B|nr:hypothetical protein [Ligilactobacillus salivarius]MBE7387056.1 hypothetical protein [Ligilactobacillus salivarius]MBE7392271.1 hypothetical protein [Ligilactobacillus salivarius]PAY33743.1 hypothetical protein A8C35_07295 [Ligilactobacillus salivarius]PAY37207.1 hypothetical protein A8C54_05565 [Ligilactobacillus salivarius]PAY41424.1 hypothetical protein A8C34_05450 [Ligilactobacillus salivarius]